MYLKLALRNAKRSIFDYLLYMVTMTILIAIMHLSNCIAMFGDMRFGFQTASLPLLIALLMVVLVNYINRFMLKQRAKEFANYLLLGMEKHRLSFMFLMEFFLMGIICFVLGGLLGTSVYLAVFSNTPQLIIQGIIQTFFFFLIVELLSAWRIRCRLLSLEISQLMDEKHRNQPLGAKRKKLWASLCAASFLILLVLLWGIAFWPEDTAYAIVSIISIPLLCCVFAFYKWIYAYLSSKRLMQPEKLWQGNRLYRIGEMTGGTRTSALMSSIFCTCLLFSATSFIFGTLMLNKDIVIFDPANQQWMGFLQVCICIIFITIYLSILSLQQITELKRQAANIRILHYMGKSWAQIKLLMYRQIMIKLFMPTLMCFPLLLMGTPFTNHKMNNILPVEAHNFLLKAVGGFIACFAVLYLCYFFIVYLISRRFMKAVIEPQ